MAKKYRKIQESQSVDYYDLESNLNNVIKTLETWKDQYGGDACLNFSVYDDYGTYCIDITLNWKRHETDKERTARLKKAKQACDRRTQNALDKVAKEKLEYERLKEKYG